VCCSGRRTYGGVFENGVLRGYLVCCSGRRTHVGVFESGVLRGIFGVLQWEKDIGWGVRERCSERGIWCATAREVHMMWFLRTAC